jgi:murein DD-endopeptidase MepM/ murein hydrolase activator NlpD
MALRSLVAAAACVAASTIASAQSLYRDEVLTSIAVRPLSVPNPVLGADNRMHLAYELAVENPGKMFITIQTLDVMDSAGNMLTGYSPDHLRRMIAVHYGEGARVAPGGTATIFLDVSLDKNVRLPDSMKVRMLGFREAVGPDGKPVPLPPDFPAPAYYYFYSSQTTVGKPARMIDPPLRGSGWLATNGCCDRLDPHRGAVLAINGNYRVPERFAIDWMQLDSDLQFFKGEKTKLANWAFYGAPVYSVAPGKVVNMWDHEDEQVPGPPVGVTTEGIGGNMVVVDIGDGAYAFYAHLQRGLKWNVGDYVGPGAIIGKLGNTGNSTAPHLHFHLMDGPSPLNANGIPYVLRNFSSAGFVRNSVVDTLEDGKSAWIDTSALVGDHANQLPLDNQVVTFK